VVYFVIERRAVKATTVAMAAAAGERARCVSAEVCEETAPAACTTRCYLLSDKSHRLRSDV